MVLKIRLRQQGRKNRQTYRLVVTDIRNPRDGKYLEMIGWYNPFSKENDSVVDVARVQYWMGQGAQLTGGAETLMARIAPDVMKEINAKAQVQRVKQTAQRRKRNAAG